VLFHGRMTEAGENRDLDIRPHRLMMAGQEVADVG
jgi:hypothetical protein